MVDAVERAIAVVAGRQHGYITRAQLLVIGVRPGAIKYRVEAGRLVPVHAGVYAVGYVRRTPEARACAAVLACGEKAALSHGSAASLWGFNKHWDIPFHVTAPSIRIREGIKVHRCRTLARRDITRQLGIRVTSPARTVLDNAPRLSGKRLSRFVNDALRTPYLHVPDLADVLNRSPIHPGTKRVLPFVRQPTNSPLEDDFLEFAKRYGLPTPVTNTHLLGYEIDVLYPRERVIVEIDGYRFHSDRDSFERDRKRDVVMLAADYVTVRITDERMEHEPEPEARRLLAILAARRNSYGSLKLP
ncbi:MAG: type IV toxin-antitoxin system AbiEi family antitoxin domain-containing protein [Solirubrobacteraceae bacterium]